MKHTRSDLLLFFFLLGAGSTIAQSVIFREFFVIFYGNELVIGFILFFWLFSITAGALLFSPMSGKIGNPDRLFINLVFIFSVLPYILIPFIRDSRIITGTPYGQFVPFTDMLWISMVAIFPMGFLIGFTFPLGCRIINDQTAVTIVYITESLGSLTGGILFSFVLIRNFQVMQIASFIVFSFAIILIAGFLIRKEKPGWKQRAAALFALIIAILLWVNSGAVDQQSRQARWRTLAENLPLLASADSPYQNIALTKQMDLYSVYFNGVYGFSFPDEYDEPVFANVVMTQHQAPQKILVIGDVTPGFIRECLRHKPDSVTVVYPDPELYKVIYPVLSDKDKAVFLNENVHFFVSDGRLFVKNCTDKFDLIYINLPDPSTAQLNRYYTLEFFRELRKISNPNAVIGLKVTSSENYSGSQILDYNRVIFNTLKQVFPFISVSSGERIFIFASADASQVTDDSKVLFERYEKKQINESVFSPWLFETVYETERIDKIRTLLEKNSEGKINTDLFPTAYLYNLKLWDKYSKSKLEKVFSFFENADKKLFYLTIFIILIPILIWIMINRKRKDKQENACLLYSVFTTGFCAMGLSVLLIYSYQNIYGFLFERIGFLIALFMFGLAVGGFIVDSLVKRNLVDVKTIILVQFLIALLCFSLPYALRYLSALSQHSGYFFFIIVVLSGILTGQIFPLAAHLIKSNGVDTDRAASLVDGFDHLGGCLAALLVAAFLTPFFGIPTVAAMLGGLAVSAICIWIIVIFSGGSRKVVEK